MAAYCAKRTAGVDVNLPLQIAGLERLNWAERGPTRVASGGAGIRAKAAISLREISLHRPKRDASSCRKLATSSGSS